MMKRLNLIAGMAVCAVVGAITVHAQAAHLILNEWNAVGGSDLLDGGSSDTYFGRVEGNGDNWFELVVVQDHVDVRGWELRWWEDDGDGNGSAVWDATRISNGESQGKLTFSNAALWSDLRAGTIITISDKEIVDTVQEDSTPVQFDLGTDVSYDPLGGDFSIHVSSRDEADEVSPLITAMTNVDGDPAGAFSVGNDDWELTIFDGMGADFGPVGEAWGDFGGINDEEVGKLEADPSAAVTLDDYNDGSSSTFGAPNIWDGGDEMQDFSALRALVPEPATGGMLLCLAGLLTTLRRQR